MATGALRLALLLPSSRSRHPMLLLRAGSDENRSAGFQPAFSLLSACFQPAFSLLSAGCAVAGGQPYSPLPRCQKASAEEEGQRRRGLLALIREALGRPGSALFVMYHSAAKTVRLRALLTTSDPCGRYVCLTCAITLKLLLPHSILTLCAPHRLMSFLESIYQNVNEWHFDHCRSPATTGTPST